MFKLLSRSQSLCRAKAQTSAKFTRSFFNPTVKINFYSTSARKGIRTNKRPVNSIPSTVAEPSQTLNASTNSGSSIHTPLPPPPPPRQPTSEIKTKSDKNKNEDYKNSSGSDLKVMSAWKKVVIALAGSTTLIYLYDTFAGSGIIDRSVRSISTLLWLSIDYKLNFEEGNDIEALHERNAQRLYDLIITNKGLYIKIGQMIAVQGMMFPKQYQDKFMLLFDRAPIESWPTCDLTLKKELGETYREDIFQSLEEVPIASASVAQVHKGILKNGDEVAVKIQKNSVFRQTESDLFTYRMVMLFYGWIFDMPLRTTIEYVCDKMREELNFRNELKNAQMVTELINGCDDFRGQYYIPQYFPEISSSKILIGEWINGDSVGEYTNLTKKGYNTSILMTQIIKFYARQVFDWGIVHCDLHPGNLMVRHIPIENNSIWSNLWNKVGSTKTRQQLIILDHGLYEHFTPKFKKEYSEFWKFSMEKNIPKTQQILENWGMKADEMIMSLAGLGNMNSPTMRAHIKKMNSMSYFERQILLRDKMKQFFENTDKFPLCLVFVMRSMRIVQGLNRNFKAPVNRLSMLVDEANESVDRFVKESGETDSWYDYLTRWYVTTLLKVFSELAFRFNKLYADIMGEFTTKKVLDVEEKYDAEVVKAGELFGFEKVPSSNELIV